MNNANMAQRISLSQAKSVDLLCDEFEADVLAGRQPRIEDFAARVTDAEREAVLRELLGIELHHRRRRGEVISPSDYDRRFPEWRLAEEEVKKIVRADSREAEPRRLDSPGDSTVMLPSVSAPPQSSRYAVMKMHARGGMGEIWLADDLQIGRRVAYKRIRAGREHIQERFIAEAQITGQLLS